MSAISVGSRCPVSGCSECRDKSGLKNEQSSETAVFTDKSAWSSGMTSVTEGTRLGPCWTSNVNWVGLADSELGCPESESLGRFPGLREGKMGLVVCLVCPDQHDS